MLKKVLIALALLVLTASALLLIFPASRYNLFQTGRPRRVAGSGPQTIEVKPGENLQSIIDNAAPGDTIVLAAGARYVANLTLPKKDSNQYITIRSSRAAELPENDRVTPKQVALLARLQSAQKGLPVIRTAAGAHNYRFIGVEISTVDPSVAVFALVELGSADPDQNTLATVPHDLVFDRCYLHGFPTQEVQRGIALNSAETSVINSWISDIHWDIDTQALCGWNGPGPFHIINNHLEAAGENVLFGGAKVQITGLIPSDIEIRGNHFYKPLSWKVGDASYAGRHWSVKNHFELKNARRVVVDGNLFENCWGDGQTGFSVVLTPRADPYATVADVTFTNNVIRNANGGVNLLGRDNYKPSATDRQKNIRLANNLFEQIGAEPLLQVNGVDGLTFDHNTCFHRGNIMSVYGEQSPRFVFTNNIVQQNQYGMIADGGGPLTTFMPDMIVARNVIVGGGNGYPGNFTPASLNEIKFADLDRSNYSLLPSSPFKSKGSDRKDPGCDIAALAPVRVGVSAL